MAPKRFGLLLNIGGAPAGPHIIEGVKGYVRPDTPSPVGGPADKITLEEARDAAKKIDCLELVEIPAGEVKQAEEIAATDVAEGRNEFAEARRDGRVNDDKSRAKDEHDAIKEL